jgi:hypothetical protein
MSAPEMTASQTIPLQLNAKDKGRSKLVGMMFSNDWEWQGESQYTEQNSGSVVSDADALNGLAMRGVAGTNSPGAWYGPYTDALVPDAPYRAYFRLKTDNPTTPAEIALLDVVIEGGTNTLGLKRIRGLDLKAANRYQEFYVDFFYPGYTTNAPEFRVAFRSTASLWLDRILVVRYPIPFENNVQWTLPDGEGSKRVIGKFLDGAGNVSNDSIAHVFFGQDPPPALLPRNWLPFILKQD